MWHVQPDPQSISVTPAIADQLVSLPGGGALPAPAEGSSAAWFGEAATGTYCGSDFATIKQTPQDGCTSTRVQRGELTSPSFSLAGQSGAYLVFRAWWEIEAVNADISDQMRVEYSADGGTSWVAAGTLNPLDPSWGGWHQPYSDSGARASATWQPYAADLSAAAGQPDVRVRFVFDTLDRLRNGFRGLLVDGVAVVDPLGATITEPGAGPFTDAPPSVTIRNPALVQDDSGDWQVHFTLVSSHTTTHPVGVGWTVKGSAGDPVANGQAVIDAGQTQVEVGAPVSGAGAPYLTSITSVSGGTVEPGGGSAPTPGGSLPRVALDSVRATAVDERTVSVSIGVRLSQPASTPVSVDYAITGADGVPEPAGTLTVPAGTLTASTTVSLPAEHAPYTVGLVNARGALIDAASASATTSPTAGPAAIGSAATDPGSQLVLGARQAAGPALGRTFALSYVSGTVRYHRPGGPYTTLPSGSVILPLGSVVDATGGHALITVEVDAQHTLQQAEIWAGKAGVFQVGSPAVTELRLAGGDYGACAGSSRNRRARRSGGTVIRRLWASGTGRFRTKGRYGSATVRGTKWETEDLCLATRFTVTEGIVAVFDFRRKRTVLVRAGETRTVGALQSARYRNRRGVHGPRLSSA